MPCPHFSKETGECVLLEEAEDDDDRPEVQLDEPVDRSWCLGSDEGYRNCPVFRRFLGDLLP